MLSVRSSSIFSLLKAKNMLHCTCSQITQLPIIAFPCHYVYARRPGRGLTEIQGASLFCNNSCCCCWQFHSLQKYNFCYQNFSLKARCHLVPFFEVYRFAHGTDFLFVKNCIFVDRALTLKRKRVMFSC